MAAALRLILSLASGRARLYGAHARRRAVQGALLLGFGTAAAVFALILATVALADWLGVIPALAIMAGVSAAGCVGVLIAMRLERRAHATALALRAEEERRAAQAAALTALPALRRGGVLAAAAAGIVALTLMARHGGRN